MKEEYFYNDDRTVRGLVSIDPYSMDPREWDNFGRMICRNRKYSLGDEHDLNLEDCNSWDDVKEVIKSAGGVLILPLGLYDHGGISMYIGGKTDEWDSGQVGFIYVTKDDLDREGLTIESAEEILRNEVKIYDAYLTGNVYRWDAYQQVKACSCGECTEWEAIESNSEYLTTEEANKDMTEYVNNFNTASVS